MTHHRHLRAALAALAIVAAAPIAGCGGDEGTSEGPAGSEGAASRSQSEPLLIRTSKQRRTSKAKQLNGARSVVREGDVLSIPVVVKNGADKLVQVVPVSRQEGILLVAGVSGPARLRIKPGGELAMQVNGRIVGCRRKPDAVQTIRRVTVATRPAGSSSAAKITSQEVTLARPLVLRCDV